jgi:hypothetical protein
MLLRESIMQMLPFPVGVGEDGAAHVLGIAEPFVYTQVDAATALRQKQQR